MSDGSDQTKKLDVSAAEMASRALKDQGIAERIDVGRQNEEISAIHQALLADQQWIRLAEGAQKQVDQRVEVVKIVELLSKMAVVYKIGFEAGRLFERETTESKSLIEVPN